MSDPESNDLPRATSKQRTRVLLRPIPTEGEGGLFSQSWFPICESIEVASGAIVGKSFLGGRVIVVRGQDGIAQVVSAYCPHMGADLAGGSVVDDRVQCPFHHWQFDREGACVRTGTGEAPSQKAVLFKYPTVERYGLVWAFNGESPLFHLPDLQQPDEDLVFKTHTYPELLNCDGWVVCANTPDMQHLKVVHKFVFHGDPSERVEWTDHSMQYNLRASLPDDLTIDFDVAILGTNIFRQFATHNGRWFSFILGFRTTAPGKSVGFMSVGVRRADDEDDAARQARLDGLLAFELGIFGEDVPILQNIHLKPGVVSKSDKLLLQFFDYVRSFPRANPGADFIE